MDTVCKLFLLFLFIFILLANAKADKTAYEDGNMDGNSFAAEPHYSFVSPESRDMYK